MKKKKGQQHRFHFTSSVTVKSNDPAKRKPWILALRFNSIMFVCTCSRLAILCKPHGSANHRLKTPDVRRGTSYHTSISCIKTYIICWWLLLSAIYCMNYVLNEYKKLSLYVGPMQKPTAWPASITLCCRTLEHFLHFSRPLSLLPNVQGKHLSSHGFFVTTLRSFLFNVCRGTQETVYMLGKPLQQFVKQ